MAWIELHQEISKHPKTFMLACLMGWSIREAVGAVASLWLWCVDFAEDGDLRRYNDAVLASAVGLNPDDGKRFVEAMVQCGGEAVSGFIDREPYFRIHDWWNYFGRYLQVKYKHKPLKWKRIRGLYLVGSKNRVRTVKTVKVEVSVRSSDPDGKGEGVGEGRVSIGDREFRWPSPEALKALYNKEAADELPGVETLSVERVKKANEYLKRFPDLQFWHDVFKQTRLSPFLRGLKPSPGHENFKATFDWLLTKGKNGVENCVKVHEGNYRDG